ncbi:MAG: triose-phosphate isomerase [Rickettsiaceae bacterium]
MKPIIIANWKMNLPFNAAQSLIQHTQSLTHSYDILLSPPAPYLAYFANKYMQLTFCAQDISAFRGFGAYTGEYSAELIKSCGVHYAIIGHSERRTMMLETNKMVNQKISNCIQADITPILCIGENLEARQNNNFKELLLEQISYIPATAKNIIIAYEPVWAIGTGISPSQNEIAEVVTLIKNNNVSLVAQTAPIVYGGSVSSNNFKEIISISGINGTLIGSASLNKSELSKILN